MTAIVGLIVLAVFFAALTYVIQNDTKWSVKHKKSTVAFQMGEQGLDRGVWKLQESDDTWNAASSGTVISGYNFDVIYTSTNSAGEVQGKYKISITSSPNSGNVLIQSVGMDQSTSEVRALQAEYSKVPVSGGLIIRSAITFKPNLYINWGPIVDYSGTVTGEPTDYPRIITKGGLTQDNNPNPPNGHDYFSNWPNPATYNYNSYQTKLSNAPTIDLESFKTLAKNSSVPALQKIGGGTATAIPTGSGYFTDTVNMFTPAGGTYLFYNSTSVIYIDAGSPGTTSVSFKGTNSQIRVRALIMTGDFEPKMLGGESVPDLTVRIPSNAQTEYYKSGAAQTYWTTQGWVNGGTTILNPVRVWGYLYVGGNCTASGAQDSIIYGTADIVGNITINNMQVYYDEFVSTGILVSNMSPSLVYWREIKRDW